MKRQTTILLATLLLGAACDRAETPAAQTQEDAAEPAAVPAPVPAPAPQQAADTRAANTTAAATGDVQLAAVASSGLALGERFAAFDIINCESGSQYCQVCKYGSNPKLMAVGTIDDEAFKRDLTDMQAMVTKYGDDKVKAFAVIAEAKDGALVTPLGDTKALQARVNALRTELKLSFPVVIPAPRGAEQNGVFEAHYQVKQSRTIMFANRRNQVTYSAVAPADTQALDAAIRAVIDA